MLRTDTPCQTQHKYAAKLRRLVGRSFVTTALCAAAALWLRTPTVAQVTQRLPDASVTVTSIVDFNGQTWVGTPEGAYRISGDSSVRIPDFKTDINGIFVVNGHVWLATTQGAFRIDGDHAVRVPDRGLVVTSVADVGGRVWLAATNGAYLVDGNDARRTPDRDFDVASIVAADGRPWIATDQGGFALTPVVASRQAGTKTITVSSGDSFTATHIVNLDYDINQIIEIDGMGWLATDHGAFRVNPKDLSYQHIELITPSNPTFRFTKKPAEVFHIINTEAGTGYPSPPAPLPSRERGEEGSKRDSLPAAGHLAAGFIPAESGIWFVGAAGVFHVEGNIAIRVPDAKVAAANIVDAAGHVWLATRQGAYRIDGATPHRIPDVPLAVNGITAVGSRVWLATTQGAYAVDGDTVHRIPDEPLSVSAVTQVGGQTFLATQNGGYLVVGDHAYPVIDSDLNVMSVYGSGDGAWMVTPSGAFRVDPSRRVGVRLIPRDTTWTSMLRSLLPSGMILAGDYGLRTVYEDWDGKTTGPDPSALAFASSSRTAVTAAVASGALVPPDTITLHIEPGQPLVYISVKDGRLPIVDRNIAIHAVAPYMVVLALAVLIWLVVLIVVVAFAPVSTACHGLLMRPGFRNAGSLGLIPLFLMLLPGLRRHVLRRFRNGLRENLGSDTPMDDSAAVELLSVRLPADRVTTYTRPDTAESFVTACHLVRLALGTHRGSFLATPPEVSNFVNGREGIRRNGMRSPLARLGRRFIPMPLLASGDEPDRLDDVAIGLLAEYGAITDASFARWLLSRGGFLFIAEGETPDALAVPTVDAFCDRHRGGSYVCLVRRA